MAKEKKKWEPRIINIMADGSVVEDLSTYVIPAGHVFYDIIVGYHKKKVREGA